MKWPWAIVPFLVLVDNVLAQQTLLGRLPDCAVQCFEATLPASTCSTKDDCLCSDGNFMEALALCNAANCTVIDLLRSTNETYAACDIPIRDQSVTMIGATASFGGLAVVMVAMRLIDRGISASAKLGWDDLLIGLAGLSSLFQNVPVVVAGVIGFGKDMWGMTPNEITLSFKWLYVTYFMYQVAEAFCQLSICAFYLRIMTSRKSRITVWILISLIICFGLGNTFAMAFQCWPIHFFWDGWRGETDVGAICTVDVRLFGFVRGGIEICLDLVILSLPLPTLAKLQMSMRKKLQVMSMFCVGFIITIVSCLRLHALVQFDQTRNPTYDNTAGVYWCVTEANLFIVVACMPAMRAILQKSVPALFSSFHEESGYGSNGDRHGGSGLGKGSFLGRQKSSASLPFGVIQKSLDVMVSHNERSDRSDRSESDMELVERPAHYQ